MRIWRECQEILRGCVSLILSSSHAKPIVYFNFTSPTCPPALPTHLNLPTSSHISGHRMQKIMHPFQPSQFLSQHRTVFPFISQFQAHPRAYIPLAACTHPFLVTSTRAVTTHVELLYRRLDSLFRHALSASIYHFCFDSPVTLQLCSPAAPTPTACCQTRLLLSCRG